MQHQSTPSRHPLPCDASLLASLGHSCRSQRSRTPVSCRWPAPSIPRIRPSGWETKARSSSVDAPRPLSLCPSPSSSLLSPKTFHRVVGEGQLGAPPMLISHPVSIHTTWPPLPSLRPAGDALSPPLCHPPNPHPRRSCPLHSSHHRCSSSFCPSGNYHHEQRSI